MADDYEGTVVWITGGSSGIGRALALEYARRGADVAISGRRLHKLETVVDELDDEGARAAPVRCDVTDQEQVASAVDEVVETFGEIDIVYANAGFAAAGSFEELTVEDWRRQFDVNVFGVVATAREALPALRRTDGRLALMGSVAATVPLPDNAAYAASKAAVRSLGQTLSLELDDSGVSCTTIQPGFVESEIVKRDRENNVREDWTDTRPDILVMRADKAARKIVRAVDKRKREYTFTGHGRVASFFGNHAPGLVQLAAKTFG